MLVSPNVNGRKADDWHRDAEREKHRGKDGEGLNIFDTWKIVDGEIVEHWDALQPMSLFMRFYNWLTGGAVRNNNGVY